VAVFYVRLYELLSRHKSGYACVTPGQKLFPVFFRVNKFVQAPPIAGNPRCVLRTRAAGAASRDKLPVDFDI
jgi:hypothetical protein